MELFSVFGRILLQDDGVEDKLKSVNNQAQTTSGGFESAFSRIKNAALKLGGTLLAGLGLKEVFQETTEGQQVLTQMSTALKSTKDASGMTAKGLLELAESQSKLTTYSKNSNLATENLLLTFTNIKGKIFEEALPAINDMSTALGQDTKSSAIQLGKALNDPIKGITALSRVGVSFTAQQKEQIKAMVAAGNAAGAQKIILQELEKEFGGSAKAAGTTFVGQLKILKNNLLEIGAGILQKLLPTLQSLASKVIANMPKIQSAITNAMNIITPAFQEWIKLIQQIITELLPNFGKTTTDTKTKVADLANNGVNLVTNALKFMANNIDVVKAGIIALTAAFVINKTALLAHNIALTVHNAQMLISGIRDKAETGYIVALYAAQAIHTGIIKANTIAQAALNAVMEANPIGIVITLIGALVAALIVLYNKNATFRNFVNSSWSEIKSVVGGAIKAIIGFFESLPEKVKSIPGKIKSFFTDTNWGEVGLDIVKGIGNGIVGGAEWLYDKAKSLAGGILTSIKNKLGIHSPSTVFRDEVGKNISLGIAQGIKDVDFMQTISDILNDGSNDAKAAAKKVTNAVNDEIAKINDNTKKAVRDLNTQLDNLSVQETKALRSVSGSKRYAIEDEYNKKKQTIKDEIQLRKDQADKEIVEIKRIGSESKDELTQELNDRKSFIESVNNLNDQIKNALKEKYTEDENNQEDSLNKELDNLDKWKDQAESYINDVYSTKEQDIEDAATAQEDALQGEIDALDAETAAEDRADKHKEYTDKISDLQSQIKYSHDDFNKAELQKQLSQEQTDYQKELNDETVSDKKDSLQKQINDVKTNADKQKQILEKEKQAELNNITSIYNAQKDSLNQQLTDVKNFYDKKLSDANLEAESEKLVMQNNQDAIIALLNSYGDQYKQAGQTLGDRLAEGFQPALQRIASEIASITASISATRDSAISAMQSESPASVVASASLQSNVQSNTNSTNTKTIINNNKFSFTHNSPTKATPSEESRQDESFFRKAAYQLA